MHTAPCLCPSHVFKHCAIHTVVSATPSFVFAVMFGWNSWSQILGMIIGIIAFLIFAWLVHLTRPVVLIDKSVNASRAFRLTKQIRLIHAMVALPSMALPPPFSAIMLPDFWAGILANSFTSMLGFPDAIGYRPMAEISQLSLPSQALVATFVEGCILAGVMVVLFLAIWAVLSLYKKVCR
ncbi:MAG: hypothetical protein KDD64_05020 [Bdellovibrionales bacterium]|nr:hypothetical protein [Bdellovibrionales bacterium]